MPAKPRWLLAIPDAIAQLEALDRPSGLRLRAAFCLHGVITPSWGDLTAKIGEGGMGEVYRARDTKLERDVALKVLPEAFTSDPDRLARFEREAKVLASLNHPNIGGIYGLEEADGTKALVLVEGPTLADRQRADPGR